MHHNLLTDELTIMDHFHIGDSSEIFTVTSSV